MAIGQFYNTLRTALWYSHFQKIHVCHHSHCNDQERDIDMQSVFFSLYPDARNRNRSLPGRFIKRYQAWLIWPLGSLQGFSLKIDSLKILDHNPRQTRGGTCSRRSRRHACAVRGRSLIDFASAMD